MKFYNIALAATVSAASVLPNVANIGGATEPKTFAAAKLSTLTWAKGYGAGLTVTSKIVEVEIPKTPAAVDVTFSAKYTGALGTATDSCPAVAVATGVAVEAAPAAGNKATT